MKIWDKETMPVEERVYIICLNQVNEVICHRCLNIGNCNTTLIDIKMAVCCVLGCYGSKIIIAHNHPSGILQPSEADICITLKLQAAVELIDVKLIDHLVVDETGYFSFCNENLLKF